MQGKRGNELRTITISTRLTPAEAAELDRQRGRIRRGTYLRLLLNNTVPPVIQLRQYDERQGR